MAERRLRRASVLGDLQAGARFGGQATPWQPAPQDNSGVGGISGPNLSTGIVTEIARSVMQIPFDDSISSAYPLECFFQMPVGTVRVQSVKVWVKRVPFRRYVSAVSASSSGGGSNQTSSSDTGHSHGIQLSGAPTTSSGTGVEIYLGGGSAGTTVASGGSTDAQGQHNHSDPQGGVTGDAGIHSHNVNFAHSHSVDYSHGHSVSDPTHTHAYLAAFSGTTDSGGGHSHTLDTTHNHTITTTLTAGIFEEALSGTVSLYASNNGSTFAGPIVSGQSVINGVDVTSYFTKTPGDRKIRVDATALMRVQVLVYMDLILEVGAV